MIENKVLPEGMNKQHVGKLFSSKVMQMVNCLRSDDQYEEI